MTPTPGKPDRHRDRSSSVGFGFELCLLSFVLYLFAMLIASARRPENLDMLFKCSTAIVIWAILCHTAKDLLLQLNKKENRSPRKYRLGKLVSRVPQEYKRRRVSDLLPVTYVIRCIGDRRSRSMVATAAANNVIRNNLAPMTYDILYDGLN